MINIDFEIGSRLPKSKRKRRLCLPVITNIMCCANLAREEGLIALEHFIPDLSSSVGVPDLDRLLKLAVQWVANGINEKDIIRFINAVLSSKDRKGTELLSFIIVAESILSICRQEHPKLMLDHIHCIIGLDLKNELDKAEKNASKMLKTQKRITNKDVINRFFSNQDQDFKPGMLDKLLKKQDESTLDDLIDECGEQNFARALLGCQKETVAFILENMEPYRTQYIRNDLLKAYSNASGDQQKEAVTHVLFTITNKKTEDS